MTNERIMVKNSESTSHMKKTEREEAPCFSLYCVCAGDGEWVEWCCVGGLPERRGGDVEKWREEEGELLGEGGGRGSHESRKEEGLRSL